MELTIVLSKIFGLYMLVAGIAVLMNRKNLMAGIVAITKERFAQLLAGLFTLLAGLILVNIQSDWSTIPGSIITLIGWAAVAKGLIYLLLPEAKLMKLMHTLTDRSWFMIDGILAMVIGLYLAGFGYGWF